MTSPGPDPDPREWDQPCPIGCPHMLEVHVAKAGCTACSCEFGRY